ncbi:hypothetical protein Micbo1qcDRAFT_8413 [Microdochium bolleyi]|uniref:PXA domain-containing protein n=1 Tax=Microdochium bolleyi TaxID=196109 RepID=A0A136JK70_9PEZI|nr:hypothetical protein Micbo1qcDRAFT_8413 [Microdochium bolleyi]
MIYRLVSHCIQTHMLTPALLPPLLRSIRGALFPNNAPGTSTLVAPASDEELAALKRRCARAVWEVIPEQVGRLYFGADAWAWLRSSPLSSKQADAGDKRSAPPEGPLAAKPTNAERTRDNGPRPTGLAKVQQHGGDSGASTHVTQQTRMRRAKQGETTAGSGDLSQQQQQPLRKTPAGSGPSLPHDSENDGHGGKSGDNIHDAANSNNDDLEVERILMEIESGILDVFSDPYCNKHLLYGILELFLVRLMPELTERGIIALLEERLV